MTRNTSEQRRLALREASEWLMRLHADECSETDLEAWGRWMAASPENSAAFDDLGALWDASAELDSAAVLNARRGNNRASAGTTIDERRRVRWPTRWVAGLAASLLAVVAVWFFAMRPGPDAGAQVIATTFGERRHVTLTDGSTVDLDAGTEIRVRYSQQRRDIELRSGQAFFSVFHAPERPFVVIAGPVQGRALGTRFAVSHRAKGGVAVTVDQGRVRVSLADVHNQGSAPVEAIVGQQVIYSADAGLQAPRDINARLSTAWREGVVIYQGESLENVIADLNRYSRIPVRLQDPALGQLKVTGRWELAATDVWVDGLARASGTRVIRSAHEILLTRNDAQMSLPAVRGGGN